jgi:hypothetical protein
MHVPSQYHRLLELFKQDINCSFDAIFAIISKTPDHRATDKAKVGAECDSLEDVRSPANPAVDGDFDVPASDGRTLSQDVQRCGHTIELPTTVVGYDDAVNFCIDSLLDIFGGVYYDNLVVRGVIISELGLLTSFEPDLQRCQLPQPWKSGIPRSPWI